jgi:hypothetical protein
VLGKLLEGGPNTWIVVAGKRTRCGPDDYRVRICEQLDQWPDGVLGRAVPQLLDGPAAHVTRQIHTGDRLDEGVDIRLGRPAPDALRTSGGFGARGAGEASDSL